MRRVLLLTTFLTMGGHASAELAAHQHGVGSLDIAIEGDEVHARLTAPADDIVGFEHAPRTDAQKAAVDDAAKLLKDGLAVLGPASEAGCKLTAAKVSSALLGDEDHHEGDGHDHKEGEHGHKEDDHGHEKDEHGKDGHGKEDHGHKKDDHGHGSKDHDDHAHGDKHEHDDDSVHSEFVVDYRLTCANISALSEMTVGFFKTFPRNEALAVRLLDAGGQTSTRLTPKENRLTVRPGS